MDVQTVEAKHIFIDIVSYTHNRSVEAQTDLISILNEIIKNAIEALKINDENVIFIPTGDGMCISLININLPYDIHIQFALSVLEKIYNHNQKESDKMRQFYIRIGVNENVDNLIVDINNQQNISGSGINYAARLENLADQSQILVGNTVFEKLVQREMYIDLFVSFSTVIKHGEVLNVHQYKNEELNFLNNEIPSKFRVTPKQLIKIDSLQGNYIALCIVLEEFISKNARGGQCHYSLQILLYMLAEDQLEIDRATRTRPNPTRIVQRENQKQFEYLQSVDFWIICQFSRAIKDKYFSNISSCFSEPYLFVSDKGRKKLLEDQPMICKKFDIK